MLLAPQSPPSKYATVPTEPEQRRPSQSAADSPAARQINWPANVELSSGVPSSPPPSASKTGTAEPTPMPAPPTVSGKAMPAQPISTIDCQVPASKPVSVSS